MLRLLTGLAGLAPLQSNIFIRVGYIILRYFKGLNIFETLKKYAALEKYKKMKNDHNPIAHVSMLTTLRFINFSTMADVLIWPVFLNSQASIAILFLCPSLNNILSRSSILAVS